MLNEKDPKLKIELCLKLHTSVLYNQYDSACKPLASCSYHLLNHSHNSWQEQLPWLPGSLPSDFSKDLRNQRQPHLGLCVLWASHDFLWSFFDLNSPHQSKCFCGQKLHPIKHPITKCRPIMWSRNLVILSPIVLSLFTRSTGPLSLSPSFAMGMGISRTAE